MEDEFVCSYKLAANMVRGGVWQFVCDTNRPAFLERNLVGLGVNDRSVSPIIFISYTFPVVTHTQSQQIPFQKCWSVSQTPPLNKFTTSLKLHTNSSFNHVTPPVLTPSLFHLQSFVCLFYTTAEEGHTVRRKLLLHFLTINSLRAPRREPAV